MPSANLLANAVEAITILNETFAGQDLGHWQKVLEDEPGVWAAYATPRETLNDRQNEPNGYLVNNVDGDGNRYRTVAAPVQFGETPPEPARAPEHGQHTEEILMELEIDWDDIEKAKAAGAII